MDGLIDEGGVMGHRVAVDDGDAETNGDGDMNTIEDVGAHDGVAEPRVGMEFDSEASAKTFYEDYARRIGFSSKVGQCSRSKPHGRVITRQFICCREFLKRRLADTCDAVLKIELKCEGKWVVTKFVKEHTHSLLNPPSKVQYLRPRRHFAGALKPVDETYPDPGIVPSGIMYVSLDGNHASLDPNSGSRHSFSFESDHSAKSTTTGALNYIVRSCVQKRTLGRDAQNLLDYFKKMQAENPGFFYAIQLDEDNRMANAFWADARSRTAYSYFGDTVTLHTMYRVNQYKVPFAPFTGVNHHGQTTLFGCALLLDDSEASFTWLFKTFLTAMNNRPPVSIITDQDRAIQASVAQVFPDTRQCISKWHVLREGQEKLAHVCHAHPNFQVALYNCINLTETIEEFESSWSSILDNYDLRRNDWLQSLYNTRAQWVPVYFRDSFFAAISPNQGFDAPFFEGYVNQQTTLPMFFRQYERALENWFEREREADFDTVCTTPLLRTPSPMEKQVANLYTRKVFTKFQEELVETFVYTANRIEGDGTLSAFRVAKFEDDHKAYIVTFNYPEMRANCSCQMFEYSGILCKHVLTVFTVTNVLTLPCHYILKRWTRNAKSGVAGNDRGGELNGQASLMWRYNNLCREAIRYAEEGAIAEGTYTVALGALREGGKKVSVVKNTVARIVPPSSQASSVSYGDKGTSSSASNMTPLLWPQPDEMTRSRFNLNDIGPPAQPVSDLNLPRMAPVSLHQVDGTTENMVVLPCLKSMSWVMENKTSMPGNRVAVINLKLHDYSKQTSSESEVKFHLSRVTLEPMLKSMVYVNEQLSTPANRVAVINLKLGDTEPTSGESDVKFQVSRDTLGAMLRSMAYIGEQLLNAAEPRAEHPGKKQRN